MMPDGPDAGGSATPNAQPRIRLVLAEDHPDVREAIANLLAPDFDVLRAVNDGWALIDAVTELKPDAVVSDIHMPGLSGIAAGAYILRQELCRAVIVVTMYNEPHLVHEALQAGIRGYVLKVDAVQELIPAVHAVTGGGRYLSRGVMDKEGEAP